MNPHYDRGYQAGLNGGNSRSGEPLGSFAHKSFVAGWAAARTSLGKPFFADTGAELIACETITEATEVLDVIENTARLTVG